MGKREREWREAEKERGGIHRKREEGREGERDTERERERESERERERETDRQRQRRLIFKQTDIQMRNERRALVNKHTRTNTHTHTHTRVEGKRTHKLYQQTDTAGTLSIHRAIPRNHTEDTE